jgi:hypothetical protein
MGNKYHDILKTLPHSMTPSLESEDCPTLEQAVDHINSIDFSLLQEKLCSQDRLLCRRWSPVEAEIGIQYYKNFLFLNKKYLDQFPVLPPMLEVDDVWHQHILDTRQYAKDCDSIFGYYFHHYPYFGTRSKADKKNLNLSFEIFQSLHEAEFGSKMLSIWGEHLEL